MENENINVNETPAVVSETAKEEKNCGPKKCRCCLNLILNIVAIVGVIVLFALYICGRSCSTAQKKSNSEHQHSLCEH